MVYPTDDEVLQHNQSVSSTWTGTSPRLAVSQDALVADAARFAWLVKRMKNFRNFWVLPVTVSTDLCGLTVREAIDAAMAREDR